MPSDAKKKDPIKGADTDPTENIEQLNGHGGEDGEYQVGYKRPPPEHRFKPGQSGNPKGRRKGSRNLTTLINEVLNRPLSVNDGGTQRNVSALMAMLMRQASKALQGDHKAVTIFIEAARENEREQEARARERVLKEEDEAILADFLHRNLDGNRNE